MGRLIIGHRAGTPERAVVVLIRVSKAYDMLDVAFDRRELARGSRRAALPLHLQPALRVRRRAVKQIDGFPQQLFVLRRLERLPRWVLVLRGLLHVVPEGALLARQRRDALVPGIVQHRGFLRASIKRIP